MGLSRLIKRAAQVNPNGVATEFGERTRSWAELEDRIARLAAGLRGLGIESGDRVAMLAFNSDDYFEYFFAVAWAGGVFVPVNTRLAPPEVVLWLEDSGTRVLLVEDRFAGTVAGIRDQLGSVEEIVHVGGGPAPGGSRAFDDLVQGHEPAPDAGRTGDDLAALFYTGGTTGRSKGVMLSHRNLTVNALQVIGPFEWQPDDVFLHAAPMFHLADGVMTFATATLGARNCFLPAFEPEATLRAIEERKVTRALLVPTMINMLVNHPGVERYNLSSLRGLVYGASPMPEAVIKRTMSLIPDVRFYQAYGQTEAAPVLTVNGPEHHVPDAAGASRLGSAGHAVPGVELAIFDEEGRELPRSTVGEISARGENVMLGYWNLPEETAETLRNGWLHTGDGGYMDEEGFVFIMDRLKDMIISGGENVFSAEVESAIHQHAGVAESAVIGIPDPTWGEQVHAIVRLHDGVDLDEAILIEHCKRLIAGYKCPRSVELRKEPLPLSGAGKILKNELRRPYWAGRERSIS